MSGSLMRRRSNAITTPTAMPIAAPPIAAQAKSAATPHRATLPPMAAMALRSATRAVASLSSDSPSRTVTMLRGRPIRRAMAVAATASGGATTAPNAIAAASGIGQQPERDEPDERPW